MPHHLFLLLIFSAMINYSLHCGIILKSGLSKNVGSNCLVISEFSSCLAAKHTAMGSPFGPDMAELIASAVSNVTSRVCGFQCAIRSKADVQEPTTLQTLALGTALKICSFDFLMQVHARPEKMCDNLPDLVVCFIAKTRTKRSRQAIELGWHVMAHIIRAKFGITCDRSFSTKKLERKCQG